MVYKLNRLEELSKWKGQKVQDLKFWLTAYVQTGKHMESIQESLDVIREINTKINDTK